MTYRESVDALMSKLDAYFQNEHILHEIGPTLEKLQVAEAKKHELVQRVEELKNLLVDKAALLEVEREKRDELTRSVKGLKQLLSDKTERIEELKMLLADKAALVEDERQKRYDLIDSVKGLRQLISDKSELIEQEHKTKEDLAKRVEELKSLTSAKTDELRGLYAQSRAEIKEARDESKLFLSELHHSQEELQKSFHTHRDQRDMLLMHQRLYARLTDLFVRLLV